MRPNDGRFSLWPFGVVGFFLILATASVTPAMRLNSKPPADFTALRVTSKGASPADAAAYWKSAVNVVQWKYPRGVALPEQALADFRVDDTSDVRSAANPAVRSAYWVKLREEWLRADNWHRSYEFDAMWMFRDLQSLAHAIGNFVQDHS